jgi:hypothetical protein
MHFGVRRVTSRNQQAEKDNENKAASGLHDESLPSGGITLLQNLGARDPELRSATALAELPCDVDRFETR